jgi:hypothetical protein
LVIRTSLYTVIGQHFPYISDICGAGIHRIDIYFEIVAEPYRTFLQVITAAAISIGRKPALLAIIASANQPDFPLPLSSIHGKFLFKIDARGEKFINLLNFSRLWRGRTRQFSIKAAGLSEMAQCAWVK